MAVAERLPVIEPVGHGKDSWPYLPELLEMQVPRYTSYPPATQFHEGVGAADYQEALESIVPGTSISLYIHIPYCHQICYHCGCNTGAANRKSRLELYLGALEKEIELVGSILGGRAKVKNIAFGGGSPNAIEPVQFVRLLDRISTIFAIVDPDISIELDPRSVSISWPFALQACNISRVSLGVQTFAPHVQKAIGRVQSFELIEECVAQLRQRDINQINFDLMYGLPKQSLKDLGQTVEKAISLAPSRIALFGYAHLPTMIPRQRQINDAYLPDTRLRFEQAKLGYEMLTAAGYHPIGFDHFALPDDSLAAGSRKGNLRRNFQGFTDDHCDIMIGLGASAISQFPDLIVQNAKRVGCYRRAAENQQFATNRGYRKLQNDMEKAEMIEELLCGYCVSANPVSPSSALKKAMAAGLVSYDNHGLKISGKGRHYSRQIASALL